MGRFRTCIAELEHVRFSGRVRKQGFIDQFDTRPVARVDEIDPVDAFMVGAETAPFSCSTSKVSRMRCGSSHPEVAMTCVATSTHCWTALPDRGAHSRLSTRVESPATV